MSALENDVARRCEWYRNQGFHCSESVIRACSDALGLELPKDVIRCACGFRGGGGGSGGRCGVIEAGILLLSYRYGRDTPDQPHEEYSARIRQFIHEFEKIFGGTDCRVINPAESAEYGSCGRVYRQGAELVHLHLEK